jgi:type II secretory pathway component HofQ
VAPRVKPGGLVLAGVFAVTVTALIPIQAGDTPEVVDLPPVPADPAPQEQADQETRQAQTPSDPEAEGLPPNREEAGARMRLRQAQVLFKLGRFTDCVEVCNEILTVNPLNREARELMRSAVDARADAKDANIRARARVGDRAALTEVVRSGTIPERGPDLPRPTDTPVPFQRDEEDVETVREALDSKIPEINLVNTDLDYLLQVLFKTHDINIFYPSDAVSGKQVTIQARDITLRSILHYLSRTQGLHYTISDGILWLYSDEGAGSLFRPEIIPLKTGLTVNAGDEPAADGGGGGGTAFGGGGGGDGGGGGASGLGGDIMALLSWMEENWPGWPEETRYMLDSKTNNLVISSSPDIIDDVRTMVEMLDVAPTQVLISAAFVEIGADDLDQLGFNWSLQGNPQDPPDPNEGYRGRDNKLTIQDTNLNAGVGGADALTTGLTGVLSEHQFEMTMSALTSRSSTKVLTRPRVIALNNHWGELRLQRAFRYASDYDTITSGVASDDSTGTATTVVPSNWQTKDLGFKLRVRPSVGRDKRTITLDIRPEITDLQEYVEETIVVTNSDGDSVPVTVKQPVFSTNEILAEAAVEDGQTVVIGGLYRDNFSDRDRKVPYLADLPVLGKLFRTKDKTRERSCLLIFVTARLITPDNRHYEREKPTVEEMQAEMEVPPPPPPGRRELNDMLGDPAPMP